MRSTKVAVLVVLLCVVFAAAAWAAAKSVGLYVNGYPVQARAIVVDGVTYVPLRAVAEALDCSVSYEPSVGVSIWRQSQPTVVQVTPASPATVAPPYQYSLFTKLSPEEEVQFQKWIWSRPEIAVFAANVDNPAIHYDFRGYWKKYRPQAGDFGTGYDPATGYWANEFTVSARGGVTGMPASQPPYIQPAAPVVTPAPTPAPSSALTLPTTPNVAENGSYYGEISENTGRPKDVYVSGYYRKDGTYVRSHYRSSPRRH